MEPKSIFKSKSFWFFFLYLFVSVAGILGFQGYQPSAEQSEIIAVVVAALGIVLRYLSKEPVKLL